MLLYDHFLCAVVYTLSRTHFPTPRRDKLWIAMEFCGGGSLKDIYHGGRGCVGVSLYHRQCVYMDY